MFLITEGKIVFYRTEKSKNYFIIEQYIEPFDIFEEWDVYAKKKQLIARDIDLKTFTSFHQTTGFVPYNTIPSRITSR
ncbi:MAG: hypothetical protein MUO73_08610 [Thermoplasmata archaeon]|nr:hypothetical protein [Thermoplasmata archaeon]